MNNSNNAESQGIVEKSSNSEAVPGRSALKFELAAQQEILRQNASRSIREISLHSGKNSCRKSNFSGIRRRRLDEEDDNDDIERRVVF